MSSGMPTVAVVNPPLGGRSSSNAATTTLLIVMILVLGIAIMYLLTRIRKQDRILDRLRKENQQQLQDDDVTQIMRHYINSTQYKANLQKTIEYYVQYYYASQYAQTIKELGESRCAAHCCDLDTQCESKQENTYQAKEVAGKDVVDASGAVTPVNVSQPVNDVSQSGDAITSNSVSQPGDAQSADAAPLEDIKDYLLQLGSVVSPPPSSSKIDKRKKKLRNSYEQQHESFSTSK
jgi:hypothetical protein